MGELVQVKLKAEVDAAKSEGASAQQRAECWHAQAQAAAEAEQRAAHAIQVSHHLCHSLLYPVLFFPCSEHRA